MSRHSRRGFTLIELLVVLVLLAVTAAAAVPAFLESRSVAPERQAAEGIAALIAQARDAAQASGVPGVITFAPREGRYWMTTGGETRTGTLSMPAGVRMRSDGRDRVELIFRGTGTSSSGSITVEGRTIVAIAVDRWTGDVTLAAHQ